MTARDFRVGDRIQNSYGCFGHVVSIRNGAVRADYKDRGGSWTETYDAAWFCAYPDMLKKLPPIAQSHRMATTRGHAP